MVSLSSTAHTIPPVLRFRATDSKSLSDSFWKSRVIACCVRSENLVKLGAGVNLSRGPVVKPSLQKRVVIRFATIEEIEAEKSAIEKDVMEKTIETLRTSFNAIRTGRANVAMLDKIEVEYYGSPVSLKSIAQTSTPDGTSLLLQPYDKSSLKAIEKAILSSDLGMTPNNDGDVIRLSMPPLTSERRKELTKVVAKQSEEGKVALRNIRRDALKSYDKLEKVKLFFSVNLYYYCLLLVIISFSVCHFKKTKFRFSQEKKLSEDNLKDMSSDLQKLVDTYMKKIEELCKQKEKELLKV
ncbi:ribosome-recycling factor, chloroplastic isoform X2 [Brassica rapa]|uniref:ribosome-recycling factor, chloroplastic isoform X2 n=1 Tax=Brassica campestris TaxID=3711 RepID=UPI00142DA840|nr:ribosome-recycling factor, chloroplastic isoform X2 [Brassica rapa]